MKENKYKSRRYSLTREDVEGLFDRWFAGKPIYGMIHNSSGARVLGEFKGTSLRGLSATPPQGGTEPRTPNPNENY